MKKKYLALLIFLPLFGFGQFQKTIRSGRPGQAIGPLTVGKNVFQVQYGLDQMSLNPASHNRNLSLVGGGVLRQGLTERVELQLGFAFQYDRMIKPGELKEFGGLSALSVNIRSNLYQGNGLIPSIALQAGLKLPWVSKIYKPSNIAPRIQLAFGQNLGKGLGFVSNFGLSWNGNSPTPTFFYVFNLNYTIHEKWTLFVEHYGFEHQQAWNGKYDGGLAFLVNNNLQLDVLGGSDIAIDVKPGWFVGLGISWRIKQLKSIKTG